LNGRAASAKHIYGHGSLRTAWISKSRGIPRGGWQVKLRGGVRQNMTSAVRSGVLSAFMLDHFIRNVCSSDRTNELDRGFIWKINQTAI
jgi:hypothetical protein